jgi:hypothetical protein
VNKLVSDCYCQKQEHFYAKPENKQTGPLLIPINNKVRISILYSSYNALRQLILFQTPYSAYYKQCAWLSSGSTWLNIKN